MRFAERKAFFCKQEATERGWPSIILGVASQNNLHAVTTGSQNTAVADHVLSYKHLELYLKVY